MVGRYDKPMLELTLSPSHGCMNSATEPGSWTLVKSLMKSRLSAERAFHLCSWMKLKLLLMHSGIFSHWAVQYSLKKYVSAAISECSYSRKAQQADVGQKCRLFSWKENWWKAVLPSTIYHLGSPAFEILAACTAHASPVKWIHNSIRWIWFISCISWIRWMSWFCVLTWQYQHP